MCFPSGGGSTTSTQVVKNDIPQWLQDAGQSLYNKSNPLSTRSYPIYPDPRLASVSPDTQQSYQNVRDAQGAWQPIYMQALTTTAQSGNPVGASDINAYMNPYTSDVVNSTVDQINRQFQQDQINRDAAMAQRGSYLNEDRRQIINNDAERNRNAIIAQTVGNLNLQGFNNAINQGNIQADRTARTAAMYSQLAPQYQALTAADANALNAIGSQQTGTAQQGLNLQYQDFLNQFYYPQQQNNWLGGILTGTPYSSTQSTTATQPNPQGNGLGSLLGLGLTAASMFGGGGGMGGGMYSTLNNPGSAGITWGPTAPGF